MRTINEKNNCETEITQTRNKTIGYMAIPIILLLILSMFGFGLWNNGTIINNCNECKNSGINWSINDGFYVNFYDGEDLIEEGNESFDISMFSMGLLLMDSEISQWVIDEEIEDFLEIIETNMIMYFSSMFMTICNSSDFLYLMPTYDPIDIINAISINSNTTLDGTDDTIYIDPSFALLEIIIAVCLDGEFYGYGEFVLFDNFEDVLNLLSSEISIFECGYIDIEILGMGCDITLESGGFTELYININGEPIVIEYYTEPI
jgi:hypothetical protein